SGGARKKPPAAAARLAAVEPSSAARQPHQAQQSVTNCQRYGCPAWKVLEATIRLSATGAMTAMTARAGLPSTRQSGIAAEQRARTEYTWNASGVPRCKRRATRMGHIPYRSCRG